MSSASGFHKAVGQALGAAVRFNQLKSLTKAGLVKRLTAALGDKDVFFSMNAAEKLAALGRADCLPGVSKALADSRLQSSALDGLSRAAVRKMDPRLIRGAMPALIALAVPGKRKCHWELKAARVALKLDMKSAAREMLIASAKKGRSLSAEILMEIVNTTGMRLPPDVLALLAEALLLHRDSVRHANALDAAVAALVRMDAMTGSETVRQLVEAERTRSSGAGPAGGGASRAFLRIAQCGTDDGSKIFHIHQALDDRFKWKRLRIGYNQDRERELKHMTRPEWIIRTLNGFFCGCEISGSLGSHAEEGIPLIEYMMEVGLTGCARALRAMKPVLEKECQLYELRNAGKLSVIEYDRRLEALMTRREKAEREARPEGMSDCCAALWRFALHHQSEILRE